MLVLGFDGVLRGVSPVLVDAVLEEDDGEETDLFVLGRVEVDALRGSESQRNIPHKTVPHEEDGHTWR